MHKHDDDHFESPMRLQTLIPPSLGALLLMTAILLALAGVMSTAVWWLHGH